jgi:hypothetical protein
MSDCSKHKKEVLGEADMKKLAEAISDLHYEALEELFGHLSSKIFKDAQKDETGKRWVLSGILYDLNYTLNICRDLAGRAWKICQPFMNPSTPQP